jgi:molecular chaperone DnaJ
VACEPCNGSGSEDGKVETCSTCHGRGQVRMQQRHLLGATGLPACSGSGKTISNPCKSCRGRGRIEEEKTLR